MMIRVYEPSAQFGVETVAYHDYECASWQVRNGLLQLHRASAPDLHLPLTGIKIFHELAEAENV